MRIVITLVASALIGMSQVFAVTDAEVRAVLQPYCEKGKDDSFVYMSVACSFARGGEVAPLQQNCAGAAKNQTREQLHLESIVENYAKAKGVTVTEAQNTLCPPAPPDPRCVQEAAGAVTIERRWEDGENVVSTTRPLKSVVAEAEAGNALAQLNLAQWYHRGTTCIPPDEKKAAQLFCKLADNGHPIASLRLSEIVGSGVPNSMVREAAAQRYGCTLTQRQQTYAAETKKLEVRAKELLKKAEGGDVTAMTKVAYLYQSDSEGLPLDYSKAFHWALRAAQKGNVKAMGIVGSLYSRGEGVEENDVEGFKWNLKAAERGDVDAQTFVGECYYRGTGVKEDLRKAVTWLSKAFNSGDEVARDTLTQMYVRGELNAVYFSEINRRLKTLEKRLPASR